MNRSVVHRSLPAPAAGIRKPSLLLAGLLFFPLPIVSQSIEFNRDIRPILSETCLACHGPDPGSRKAGLRFDTKEGLFTNTRHSGPVIEPGAPDKSALLARILSTDPDEVMPPPEANKDLTPVQKNLIRQWIEEGAPWQPHWAFLAPEAPPVPKVSDIVDPPPVIRNPIDAFVAAKLSEKGLAMNPPADRRTLARRLALDLTGLPPTPELVEAFVEDDSPDYYERYVRGLMDTPQWGEHRARYWLDAARYADTHGLHFDNYREIWPYRDWVISAFNKNQPFDKFIVEQLAGDLLDNPTQDQLVATGFQRCNITTNEGGTIEEENLAIYATDRVSTTGWVFLGLTMNCAECHDHKFDPITQRDFYSMAAFFRNTEQPGLDGNEKDSRPSMTVVSDPMEYKRWTELPSIITQTREQRDARRSEARPDFNKWANETSPDVFTGKVPHAGRILHAPLNEGSGNQLAGTTTDAVAFTVSGEIAWVADGKTGPAPKINSETKIDLGDVAGFERDQPFSYGAWVRVPSGGRYEAILARMDQEKDFRGWDLFTHDRNLAVHIIHRWPDNAVKIVTTDNPIQPGTWQHVWVSYDGTSRAGGIQVHVNGKKVKTRTEVDKLTETIVAEVPVTVGQRSRDQKLNEGQLQDVRIHDRVLDDAEILALATDAVTQSLLAIPSEQRNDAQKESLFAHYIETRDEPFLELTGNLRGLESELDAIRQRNPVTLIQREKQNSEPVAAILIRGQYNMPGEKVGAAVPSALPPLPEGAPANRLGLAQWIVAPENPLAARVTVNRFWQEIFGVGLVATADDFGIMGENPVHRELLDWLAVAFRESGWDVKQLFEWMVTSTTYRQSAHASAEKLELDRDNRLFSRGPRFRMDAEMVRDYALAVSDLLVPAVGGPSVKPYQPDGVWEAVAMPESNTRRYSADSGEALYRRSMYTFWKRAAPPASMDIFNAPSREVSCNRRERTNTPLQALATLNDPQFVEAARRLAENALKHNEGEGRKAIDWMVQRVLARPLKPLEQAAVTQTWNQALGHFEASPDDATLLLSVGQSPPDPALKPVAVAAATIVANQLLNLDEVLNK